MAYPMLMAVSSLSPVSTQILIIALASCAMQFPTFSCSLSCAARRQLQPATFYSDFRQGDEASATEAVVVS